MQILVRIQYIKYKSEQAATMAKIRKIILADDDPNSRSFVLQGLFRHLFPKAQIRSAVNGKEAWQMAQDDPPDLLWTDMSMPEMNGLDLARIFHAANPRTPIIMFAATPVDETEARAAGIGLVINKRQAANLKQFREDVGNHLQVEVPPTRRL
jgi:CheY-like chemotaxis protein